MLLKIKKEIEETMDVSLPYYAKSFDSYYKVDTLNSFLKIENGVFVKQIQTVSDLERTTEWVFANCQPSTEDEFNANMIEVMEHITDTVGKHVEEPMVFEKAPSLLFNMAATIARQNGLNSLT